MSVREIKSPIHFESQLKRCSILIPYSQNGKCVRKGQSEQEKTEQTYVPFIPCVRI